MRKLIVPITLLTVFLPLRAQKFTAHLEQEVAGQGSVTVNQDTRLTGIVDGDIAVMPVEEEKVQNDFSMQTGKRKRMRGYRIQMYWGSSQRSDQQKALRMGTQVKNVYPELEAYTTFESPHWRCRVGDFKTREEANAYLSKLRRISHDAMVVQSEIIVFH